MLILHIKLLELENIKGLMVNYFLLEQILKYNYVMLYEKNAL